MIVDDASYQKTWLTCFQSYLLDSKSRCLPFRLWDSHWRGAERRANRHDAWPKMVTEWDDTPRSGWMSCLLHLKLLLEKKTWLNIFYSNLMWFVVCCCLLFLSLLIFLLVACCFFACFSCCWVKATSVRMAAFLAELMASFRAQLPVRKHSDVGEHMDAGLRGTGPFKWRTRCVFFRVGRCGTSKTYDTDWYSIYLISIYIYRYYVYSQYIDKLVEVFGYFMFGNQT